MRILFDILHPAHLNFYKKTIQNLQAEHDVTVLVRPRGDLVDFAEKMLKIPIKVVGRHYGSRIGKLFGLFHRIAYLLWEGWKNPYDVATSHGGFYVSIACWIMRKRSVVFYDNAEYKLLFFLCRRFSSKFMIPQLLEIKGKNIGTFNGYKELAYLNRFEPAKEILKKYGVEKKKYVFIRQIAHISLDYWSDDSSQNMKTILDYLYENKVSIIASVEEGASQISKFREFDNIYILPESTSEMHTLLYYAKCVISSGDTVAREAALLGTPAIYIGGRDMKINSELMNLGRLNCPDALEIIPTLERVLREEKDFSQQNADWDDTTDVIIQELIQYDG